MNTFGKIPNFSRIMLSLGFGLLAFGFFPTHAAETPNAPAATGAPVELPPMLVEESISSAPWYHVNIGGTEFLSRCSASTTHRFIEAWLEKMQLVRALVPPEFLARTE